jgi:TolA-binding protein
VKLKLAAYVLLVALAIWSGLKFHSNYSKIGRSAGGPATNTAEGSAAVPATNTTPSPAAGSATNTAASPAAKPRPGPTNQTLPSPALAVAANHSTNSPAGTNPAAGSNLVRQPAAPDAPPANTAGSNSAAAAVPATTAPPAANPPQGSAVGYLAVLVVALIGLGLMATYDITHLMGARAIDYLFDNLGEGARDPEYERAEQLWVNGKPLEAIEMMREYLAKNPREQYVALRIAEIYEKDLNNYVAASLEYEEILKKRLPAERWGRAAIHLCNIYSRMGQQDKMRALLERIARDYPKTAAAKKARQNLGLPEPEEEEEAAPAAPPPEPVQEQEPGAGQVFDLDEMIAAADEEMASQPPETPPPPPPPPKSTLPPGFRKKE